MWGLLFKKQTKHIKVYECSKDGPDKIEDYVVPHVTLEGATNNESNSPREVGKEEKVTTKLKCPKEGESIGGEDGDGSKPPDKISEYF